MSSFRNTSPERKGRLINHGLKKTKHFQVVASSTYTFWFKYSTVELCHKPVTSFQTDSHTNVNEVSCKSYNAMHIDNISL